MMHMEHRLTQTQSQSLVLTQKMQQALHILQLSGMELEQYVQQELETNPFLDQVAPTEARLAEAAPAPSAKEEDVAFDESFDLDAYRDSWDLRLREGRDLSRNPDLDERRQYYQDSITKEESLRGHLLTQLRLNVEDEETFFIGERIIIGDIDERGYFTGNEADIAAELGVTEDKVAHALAVIQRFEPTGVGARSIVECLLLQIKQEYPREEQLKTLVTDHLDDLMQRQIPKIARAMSISPERVEQLKEMLATLDPYPGRAYSDERPQYVVPEVVVEKIEDEFVVRLSTEHIPEIAVNKDFHDLVRSAAKDKEEREYMKSKLEAARWLKRNITQRQQTILRVSEAIVRRQKEFLEKGVEFIKPLKLQDIAEELGLHESTIARTTRGKYMQTPQGLFELKYFFSPGLKSDSGESQSSKSIQAMVQRLIDAEDKRKPLSDQKIADMLKKSEGINIARRTVTKYREALNIPATTMRRQY